VTWRHLCEAAQPKIPPWSLFVHHPGRLSHHHHLLHGPMPETVCLDKMEEEAKKIFFRELYHLDDEDSEDEDSGNAILFLKSSKASPSTARVEAGTPQDRFNHCSRPNPPLKHIVSEPLLLSSPLTTLASQGRPTASQSFPSSLIPTSPMQQAIDHSNGVDKAGQTRIALMPKHGKRKRGRSLEPRPASLQIFLGLSFCKLITRKLDVIPRLKMCSLPSQR